MFVAKEAGGGGDTGGSFVLGGVVYYSGECLLYWLGTGYAGYSREGTVADCYVICKSPSAGDFWGAGIVRDFGGTEGDERKYARDKEAYGQGGSVGARMAEAYAASVGRAFEGGCK